MKITGTAALVAMLFVLGERTADAQVTDPAAAEALFQEGRRLLKSVDGDVATACAKFDESQRLDPAIGTLINVAACQERLGRTATAWQSWRAAADQLGTTDQRRPLALKRAAALEKVLPRLIVTVGPDLIDDAAVEIRRDGIRMGRASLGLPLPLDPGPHLVTVVAPGRQMARYELSIRPRENRTLLVAPGPESPPPLQPVAEKSNPTTGVPVTATPVAGSAATLETEGPAFPRAGIRKTLAGWALIGAAALAVGTAGYLGLGALDARHDAEASCPGPAAMRLCLRSGSTALDRDRHLSLGTDVALGAGVLLAGSGLFLLRTGGRF